MVEGERECDSRFKFVVGPVLNTPTKDQSHETPITLGRQAESGYEFQLELPSKIEIMIISFTDKLWG